MPVFAHSQNAELNPLLAIKKQVVKTMKKAFQSEPQNNLVETAQAHEIYELLSSTLTKIQSLLGEIITLNANFVDDNGNTRFEGSRTEHIVGVFSQLLNITKSLDRYLMKLPNLNMLTQPQYEDVASSISTISSYNEEIQSYDGSAGKQLGWFRTDRLFPEYLAVFQKIFVRLRGYIMSAENGGSFTTETAPVPEAPDEPAANFGIDDDFVNLMQNFLNINNNNEDSDDDLPNLIHNYNPDSDDEVDFNAQPQQQQAAAPQQLNKNQKLARLREICNALQPPIKAKNIESLKAKMRARNIQIPPECR